MCIHKTYQRVERIGANHRITVEQQHPSTVSLSDRLVIRPRKADVVQVPNQMNVGIVFAHQARAAIGRGIVDDEDLKVSLGWVSEDGLQALLEQVARVPVDDDDREVYRGRLAALPFSRIHAIKNGMAKDEKITLNVEMEARRQQALALAEQYARLLRERFGAWRVIPFGSLIGDSPWHTGSDLDLAVEGLSSRALWEAARQLDEIAPAWLDVELVPLERAYPEVRAHILGERTMPENKYLALTIPSPT